MCSLQFNYCNSTEITTNSHEVKTTLPFANTDLFSTDILSGELLTSGEDVKCIYRLILNRKGIKYDFKPGDTIGICPENNHEEVEKLLKRLNLISKADQTYHIDCVDAVRKKILHIPKTGNLRTLFTRHLDVRSPPKKAFLKNLIGFCTTEEDKNKLLHISSPEGSKEYLEFLNRNRSLLCLLNMVPSCTPTIECLVQFLPSLLPRPYSLSSSPNNHDELHIIFSVDIIDENTKGVCTGWLEYLIQNPTKSIQFYFRKPTNFRLTQPPVVPLIIVASGTGIAPFLSFLSRENHSVCLFYGCRYAKRDCLIDQSLNIEMFVSFSREGDKNYVQDLLKNEHEMVCSKLLNEGANMFVCGNNRMVKNVKETLIENLMDFKNVSQKEASVIFENLCKSNRYVSDAWT